VSGFNVVDPVEREADIQAGDAFMAGNEVVAGRPAVKLVYPERYWTVWYDAETDVVLRQGSSMAPPEDAVFEV
jgi:hypothetical protein